MFPVTTCQAAIVLQLPSLDRVGELLPAAAHPKFAKIVDLSSVQAQPGQALTVPRILPRSSHRCLLLPDVQEELQGGRAGLIGGCEDQPEEYTQEKLPEECLLVSYNKQEDLRESHPKGDQ